MKKMLLLLISIAFLGLASNVEKSSDETFASINAALNRLDEIFRDRDEKEKKLQDITLEIAEKMKINMSGWQIFLSWSSQEAEASWAQKTIQVGEYYVKNEPLLRGVVVHELGHAKHDKQWHFLAPVVVGYGGGFLATMPFAEKFAKKCPQKFLIGRCAAMIFMSNVAFNIYRKYTEYRADTVAINHFKQENNSEPLQALVDDYSRHKPSRLERTIGRYGIEIVDILISSPFFEKVTIFGGHPSFTSRIERFEKAIQDIKIKEL